MISLFSRRDFIRYFSIAASFLPIHGIRQTAAKRKTTHTGPEGYFTTGNFCGRRWFITPGRTPFFSIGLNHIDSASLRYQDNHTIWDEKYNYDIKLWLSETVRKDLISYGFNTVRWNQEYVMEGHHYRNFTPEEYRWLDMPYGHMLRFSETHQWETETRHPDISSEARLCKSIHIA